MENKIPDFIVHYSRSRPFRSITSVAKNELDAVLSSLDENNTWGINRFSDPSYLRQRFEVESLMRRRFIESGGVPALSRPIYFFLGRNACFEKHPLNTAYAIDINNLSRETVSFSYGDTMLSFVPENRKLSGAEYENQLCDKLFMLDELSELYESEEYPSKFPLSVEAHLWVVPSEDIVKKLNK